jgi:threonine dehydratase
VCRKIVWIVDLIEDIAAAEQRIKSHLRVTPLEYSYPLSEIGGCKVYLKLENQQVTGSFKARGALNKIKSLERSNSKIVTASTGNHGLGVANALMVMGRDGTVYLPVNAQSTKADSIRMLGVKVEFHGQTCEETERHVRHLAESSSLEYISPYNDREVIAGQGTIGAELFRQAPDLDVVFVSVGGGGLVGGTAAYLKAKNPRIHIVGCLAENSPVMLECIRAGRIYQVSEKPTLSDGTAGGIEASSITFPLCQQHVDSWMLTSEIEILEAMKLILVRHHQLIEGSAGVAVGAMLKMKEELRGKKVAIVLCGGNVGEAVLNKVICS